MKNVASNGNNHNEEFTRDVALERQQNIYLWAYCVRSTFHASGKGLGKTAALKQAKERLPGITSEQFTALNDGSMTYGELGLLFGHEWITDGAE